MPDTKPNQTDSDRAKVSDANLDDARKASRKTLEGQSDAQPQPSQDGADAVKASDEKAAKDDSAAAVESSEATLSAQADAVPQPSQADADAIKEGVYKNRALKTK